ncbi:hypothetical protein LZ554_002788 [Drepanopeziza brunnea f. sp. 'monogermtubi']|nr:hypothetical protein LZ554_002788 [Drepanopeziza brunnea f. sp. 'monogermtubi']
MSTSQSRRNSRIFDKPVRVVAANQAGPARSSLANPRNMIVEKGGLCYLARDITYRGNGVFQQGNLMPHTIVVSIHGECKTGRDTTEARATYGIYVGKGSEHNEGGELPETEKQTAQVAPLYAVKRAIEIVEDQIMTAPDLAELKTVIIKTHKTFLINCLSCDVWEWERNDYQNSEGFEVTNRLLIEKVHDMLLEAKRERGLRIKFWPVDAEENFEAFCLAHIPFEKRVTIAEPEPRPSELEQAVMYYMFEAPKDPTAQALSVRLDINLPSTAPDGRRNFPGVTAPIRRLVIMGEDRPRNFERLFGATWKALALQEWRELRHEVLAVPESERSPAAQMLDRGTPYYRPRAPTTEEKRWQDQKEAEQRQEVERQQDVNVTITLADLMNLALGGRT